MTQSVSDALPYEKCPTCATNWRYSPPAKIDGQDAVRCIECKAVYPLARRSQPTGAVTEAAEEVLLENACRVLMTKIMNRGHSGLEAGCPLCQAYIAVDRLLSLETESPLSEEVSLWDRRAAALSGGVEARHFNALERLHATGRYPMLGGAYARATRGIFVPALIDALVSADAALSASPAEQPDYWAVFSASGTFVGLWEDEETARRECGPGYQRIALFTALPDAGEVVEPVAWRVEWPDGLLEHFSNETTARALEAKGAKVAPLFTAPRSVDALVSPAPQGERQRALEEAYAEYEGVPAKELAETVAHYGKALKAIVDDWKAATEGRPYSIIPEYVHESHGGTYAEHARRTLYWREPARSLAKDSQ